jgi:hypothetical protein
MPLRLPTVAVAREAASNLGRRPAAYDQATKREQAVGLGAQEVENGLAVVERFMAGIAATPPLGYGTCLEWG